MDKKTKEILNDYEKMLSTAKEVKQNNTDEFMIYWESELKKHIDFWKLQEDD
jgi:hypothetical protein